MDHGELHGTKHAITRLAMACAETWSVESGERVDAHLGTSS